MSRKGMAKIFYIFFGPSCLVQDISVIANIVADPRKYKRPGGSAVAASASKRK